jgi:hypothetical protein
MGYSSRQLLKQTGSAAIVMSASDTNRVDPVSLALENGSDSPFSPLAYGNTHSGEAFDGRLVSDAVMF